MKIPVMGCFEYLMNATELVGSQHERIAKEVDVPQMTRVLPRFSTLSRELLVCFGLVSEWVAGFIRLNEGGYDDNP